MNFAQRITNITTGVLLALFTLTAITELSKTQGMSAQDILWGQGLFILVSGYLGVLLAGSLVSFLFGQGFTPWHFSNKKQEPSK